MALAPGTRLGHYQVGSAIGAGGMGEVYRAHDPRLGRDVAIKVLRPAHAADEERLRRFELEARATGALNHPNVLAVYDVGQHDGAPYLVCELLEGRTLRERLSSGALPLREAVDIALQVARGIAVAHDKGVVHRDLKPENIFLTRDRRAKVLDFGLAKLTQAAPAGSEGSQLSTADGLTGAGVVLGTVGYMSPEQVRGETTDHRSDIFSLGAVLYEMLGGQRAFKGATPAESMAAILRDEPPDLAASGIDIPPTVDRVLRHCLEKRPDDRFQSARDLVFSLEALESLPSASDIASRRASGSSGGGNRIATLRRITFRRGNIGTARFGPDGHTVVYGAALDGKPLEIYSGRTDSSESRPLGLPPADLLAVSSRGELAIGLRPNSYLPEGSGTLARVSLAGGAPKEVLERVEKADWSPDGSSLAIVHAVSGRYRIEYPIGETFFESPHQIESMRVSPHGDRIAFIGTESDNTNTVVVVGGDRKATTLSSGWSVRDVVWGPSGDEVWFTGARGKGPRTTVFSVDLRGRLRVVYHGMGPMLVHDVTREGRALLERVASHQGLLFHAGEGVEDRDLGWHGHSEIKDLSADGRVILFAEAREQTPTGAAYLRRTDGLPAVRLGDVVPLALSPDGRHALAMTPGPASTLLLLPTGPGEPRALTREGLIYDQAGTFFPDGRRVAFTARERGLPIRLWVQDVEGGDPRLLSAEGAVLDSASMVYGADNIQVSHDGRTIATVGSDRKIVLFGVDGGEPLPIVGARVEESPVCFSSDGRALFTSILNTRPMRIYRHDLATGEVTVWKELHLPDLASVPMVLGVRMTPDGTAYAYSVHRILVSDLYLAEGLR